MNENEKMDWKLRRIRLKIKLIDMEEFCGCTYNLISLYENNHKNMDDEKIEKYKRYIESKEQLKV